MRVALFGGDGPAAIRTLQGLRVTLRILSADRKIMRVEGARDAERIGIARRLRPEHTVFEHRRERRLERDRLLDRKFLVGNAVLVRERKLGGHFLQRILRTIDAKPAGMTQIALRARSFHERLVFRQRILEQRTHHSRGLLEPFGRGRLAHVPEPARDPRQEARVIVRFRRKLERNAAERANTPRKRIGKKRVAFDDPGIAIGRTLARPLPVDEQRRDAPLLEMKRGRDADDAGPKNDNIFLSSHSIFLL